MIINENLYFIENDSNRWFLEKDRNTYVYSQYEIIQDNESLKNQWKSMKINEFAPNCIYRLIISVWLFHISASFSTF